MMVPLLLLFATPQAGPVDAGPSARAPLQEEADGASAPRPIEPREDADVDAGVDADDDDADADADAGTASAAIPNVTLNATIEPAVVPFGGAFELVLTIVRDRGVKLEMPGAIPDVEAAPKTGDPVRSVEELPPAPTTTSNANATTTTPPDAGPGAAAAPPPAPRVKETIRIPFLALDTEKVKTPAFSLTGTLGTVEVPSLDVKVEVPPDDMPNPAGPDAGPLSPGSSHGSSPSVPPGAVVLEPHAPAIAYTVPDKRPFVILGAFAVAGLAFALVRFFAARRKARMPAAPAPPPPPPRPAHEVALERLEALLASGLLQRGETAIFVERLMDEVLRDYIEARFSLSAGTRTTRELVKALLGVAVLGLDVALVESLLADADLVKFAKASIAAERANAMASRVRALIEATKLAPASPSSSSPSPSGAAS